MSCSHCDKSSASKKCPCLGVTYCDSACQKADWKRHKPSCPPYRIQQIPGKGKGMVATRKIKAGVVILEETPLLYVNDDDGQQESVHNICSLLGDQKAALTFGQQIGLSKEDMSKVKFNAAQGANSMLNLLKMYQTLPDDQKQKSLSLHDPGESSIQQCVLTAGIRLLKEGISKDEIKFVRIVMANRIAVSYSGNDFTVKAYAVYGDVSRINHSCNPNCVWTLNKSKQVYALKNIEKGEEIVASYITDNLCRLRRDRQAKLMKWNFGCHCKLCSLEEEELKKNEELRSKIIKLHENMIQFLGRGEDSNALSAAKEKLELMSNIEDELVLQMPEALLDIYEISILWGNSVNVKGSLKKKLKEEAEEYKNGAFILARKLGRFGLDLYERRMNKMAMRGMASK